MTMELWFALAGYLIAGGVFSWMSSVGHKSLYGRALPWPHWVAGVIGWPIPFLLAALRRL